MRTVSLGRGAASFKLTRPLRIKLWIRARESSGACRTKNRSSRNRSSIDVTVNSRIFPLCASVIALNRADLLLAQTCDLGRGRRLQVGREC